MSKQEVLNRTKIVCTIGPASRSQSVLREMMRAGMDVARVNFSHGSVDDNLAIISGIKEAAKAEGKIIPIMQDLQGPKLRVGELPEEGVELLEDTVLTLKVGANKSEPKTIPVPYERLHEEVSRGDRILLNDGLIELEVLGVQGKSVSAKVVLGGKLLGRQGLTVPSRSLDIDALTDKDRKDLVFGLEANVDFIALSFVKTADDVRLLKKEIEAALPRDTEPPGIVVKIEKHEAVKNFDAILEEADAVMVARGDLGLETSFSTVPVTQKALIAKCVVAGKPVITATHMLSSMTIRPRPTRAEASDVANAVIDHTDAVMLSEETATGRFPVRSVAVMAEIIMSTEESPLDNLKPEKGSEAEPVSLAVAGAAVEMARHVKAEAILVTTASGYSARSVARFRPETSIFAATPSPRLSRQLMLSWGVTPIFIDGIDDLDEAVKPALEEIKKQGELSAGDKVAVVSGLKKEEGGFDSAMRLVEV